MLYYSDQLEVAINAMKSDNEQTEIQKKLLSQHELCNAAHEELKEEDTETSSQREDMDNSCRAALHSGKSSKRPSDQGGFETSGL